MIVDKIPNAALFAQLHSRFPAAFDFLAGTDFAQLEDGKHAIDGDQLFVIVATDQGKGREQAMLEFHRKYIDIQFVIEGEDQIGWVDVDVCTRINGDYDPEKDLGFYFDRPETWLHVPANSFAIFLPGDAHAPLGCETRVRKAVVKVAL